MPANLVAIAFDSPDPDRDAAFWAGLLGRQPTYDAFGALLAGTSPDDASDATSDDAGHQVGLRFLTSTTPKTGPGHLHLHVTTRDVDDRDRTVQTALDLGGHHLDVGQLPEEGHVVLADPGGDELCVIEPGNSFLAGCGRLGEVACEGTRATGVFWAETLGWPLVWDQDGETAIQSPHGGTKIAWGGPPIELADGPSRQRFELSAADPRTEADRLVGLGATLLGEVDRGITLSDPDGTELIVTQADHG